MTITVTRTAEIAEDRIVAGQAIAKAIPKRRNVAGKTVAAEEADLLMIMTMLMTDGEAAIQDQDAHPAKAVDGMEILRDILKLPNADGKIVVVEEAVLLMIMTMMKEDKGAIQDRDGLLIQIMTTMKEDKAAIQDRDGHLLQIMMMTMIEGKAIRDQDVHQEKAVDGMAIPRDIPKLLNAAGKTAVADEAVLLPIMMKGEEEVLQDQDPPAKAADGMAIRKDILKLQNADGKIVAEAATALLQTMIPELAVFHPGPEDHQSKAADGMVTLKDIQKRQKKAGETGNYPY